MFRKILSIGLALFLLVDEPIPAIAQSANPVVVAGTPTLTDGQAYPLTLDTAGRLKATVTGSGTFSSAPTTATGQAYVRPWASSSAGVSNLPTSAGQAVYGWQVTSGASAGFVLISEGSGAVPSDGAISPNECYVLAANSTLVRDYSIAPMLPFVPTNKTFIMFSTTGCGTKTASATAFIAYRAQ